MVLSLSLSLRLTSVYLTTQIFDKFGDQEEYGHIEQDSTRVHDSEKKKKIVQEHFPGGRHCRREELFSQNYIPTYYRYLPYLRYAHRVG